MPKYQALKGMRDILPGEVESWQELESQSRHFFEAHGFEEIRTPLLEPTELFSRSIGEGSDIVHKQMYTFEDRGGRMVTLRPEMTASVLRAAIENGILRTSKTSRFYYLGPMFRAERPQKGRQRQFYQLGAEILSAKKIEGDIEIVSLTQGLFEFLDIPDFCLKHNYLGGQSEREAYTQILKDYFSSAKGKLCEDCHFRIEKNVLRVLDCKVPECQPVIESAPAMKLSQESMEVYAEIQNGMRRLKIKTKHDPRLVRGLDYYTGLVFEVVAGGELGAQDAIAAGGRYDHLIALLGGSQMGATGFAAGMERILLARKTSASMADHTVYVATLDSTTETRNYFERVVRRLYEIGKKVRHEPDIRTLTDHLKKANKMGIKCVVIIGENEIRNQKLTVKNLETKVQEEVSLEELTSHLFEK